MPPTRIATGATPAITVSGAAAAITRKAMPPAPRALVLRCSVAPPLGGGGICAPGVDRRAAVLGCAVWLTGGLLLEQGRASGRTSVRASLGGVAAGERHLQQPKPNRFRLKDATRDAPLSRPFFGSDGWPAPDLGTGDVGLARRRPADHRRVGRVAGR